MQAVMQNEIDFCRLRAGNIWKEVTRTREFGVLNAEIIAINSEVLSTVNPRIARQAGYGGGSSGVGGFSGHQGGGGGGKL